MYLSKKTPHIHKQLQRRIILYLQTFVLQCVLQCVMQLPKKIVTDAQQIGFALSRGSLSEQKSH